MKEAVFDFLGAIERPLRFLAKAGPRQIQSVKNLPEHIREVSGKALATNLSESDAHRFRSIQSLFADFESLESHEKRDRIAKALRFVSSEIAEPVSERVRFLPEDHILPSPERMKEALKHLSKSVQYVKGVGPEIGEKFLKGGIQSVNDLLFFFPLRYEDRRTLTTIKDLKEGETATVVGEVQFAGIAFYKGLRRRVFEAVVDDGSGVLKLKWFRFYAGTLDEKIKKGKKLIVHGKVQKYRSKFEMHHPDFEVQAGEVDSLSFGKIVPVYSEIGGMYQKTLRRILHQALGAFLRDRLCLIPPDICKRNDLLPPWKAIHEIHHPEKIPPEGYRTEAQKSLSFEEMFFYCLSLALRKQLLAAKSGIRFTQESPRFEQLLSALPFQLTRAQNEVLRVVREDMAREKPMNRLLQGDVGSGKTIVAFLAGLIAIDHGFQVIFMAPTEILAEQHLKNLSQWGSKVNVRVEMMTGRTPAARRQEIVADLKKGEVDVIVGTHALLEKDVRFKDVGLVIVDEQHRFGVHQRALLRGKGREPDVLVMSATPIPRTLSLTLYGDLDVSVLNELPAGRQPITTRIFRESDREQAYKLIADEVKNGRQAYIVYPLIEPSEKIELKDATSMAETLARDVFPNRRVGLLHGALSGNEKEKLMRRFAQKEIDILVATTVIEVGIDVPNATVMMIEHPERFGLSQLHQLRGRVGRGTEKSFCLLLVPPRITQLARERVQLFSRIHDGFLLAEEDLRLRGPGDFFGAAQSGFPNFQIAAFPRDLDLLERARREAFQLLERDAGLSQVEHRHLKMVVNEVWIDRIKLVRVG
jgi:ATP-dependent DNA helicase RecG